MLKKLLIILTIIFLIYFYIDIDLFLKHRNKVQNCYEGLINNSYYNRLFCSTGFGEVILPKLLIYKVPNNKFEKLTRFESYIVPTLSLKKADAIISFGVDGNINFEKAYSQKYKIPAYIFHCGTSKEFIREMGPNKYCRFYNQCIKSEEPYNFKDKLKELGLQDKKIYLKLNYEYTNTETLNAVLKYSKNITGISCVLNLNTINENYDIIKIIQIMNLINKDFVLTERNTILLDKDVKDKITGKYSKGIILNLPLFLTYINKNIAGKFYLPLNQSNPKYFKKYMYRSKYPYIPNSKIDYKFVLEKKFKTLKEKMNKSGE